MTLHRALIWGMEKGRGQEARQRFKAPETPTLSGEARMMPFQRFYGDSMPSASAGLRHAV
jgi:hypothetical protein